MATHFVIQVSVPEANGEWLTDQTYPQQHNKTSPSIGDQ